MTALDQTAKKERKVVAKECRFVTHIPKMEGVREDIHLIKEWVHYDDGSKEPNLKRVLNYKRPFWVTAPAHRDHLQKKEYEHHSKLIKYECTQSDLRNTVARALNQGWSRSTLRELQNSPYLYGTDVDSTVFIKHAYKKKFPDTFTPSTICTFDTETDVVRGTGEIIMASACFDEFAIAGVTEKSLEGFANPQERFKQVHKAYLLEHIPFENVVWFVSKTPYDILKEVFAWIHKRKPDFLAIWNMDFDVSKILECCKAVNKDPSELFSDPSIPKGERYFHYHRGATSKTTASGVFKPKQPSEQWHTVYCSSSFYVIDPMCVYRQIRITGQQEQSYALDALMNKFVQRGKLKFSQADGLAKLKWHYFMQKNYPVEYSAYNIFDSFGMLLFDKAVKDLCLTLPTLASNSHYSRFNSQPKRIHDEYFFFCRDQRGLILASLPADVVEDETAEDLKADLKRKEMEERFASEDLSEEQEDVADENIFNVRGTLGLKGWVLTLDPQNIVQGLKLAVDDRSLHTNCRFFVFDSDATAAYPTIIDVTNSSRTTTKKELIAVDGVDREVFRMCNLGFVLGAPNTIEYCQKMHGLAGPADILQALEPFMKQKEKVR